jgi:hypothetical protein
MAIRYQIQINDGAPRLFRDLGLDLPKYTKGNMDADMVTIDHLRNEDGSISLRWDQEPLLAYKDDITIWKNEGVTSTRVFRGLRRTAPTFMGATAESISYTVEGPWGWLKRRPLLQNAAVPPTEGIGPPNMVPQGLVIFGQDDSGVTVNLAQALHTVLQQAVSYGVPITIGNIVGFDFASGWDWMRDPYCADAIIRLLQVAPDAVVEWDYATVNPTIHIRRRGALPAVSFAVAPKGTPLANYGPGGYAEFETLRIVDRPDLVIPGCWVTFRSVDSSNGVPSLRLQTDVAKADGASMTDENALVRTIELAGSSRTTNTVSQECVTAIIPIALAGPGNVDPEDPSLTPAKEGFQDVVDFLARSESWLKAGGTVVTKLTPRGSHSVNSAYRRGLEPDGTGKMVEVWADMSLTRELVLGFITPWMKTGSLNRKSQEQEVCYDVEATWKPDGLSGVSVTKNGTITRAFTATNASTRIGENAYRFEESSDSTEAEPKPEGLAQALYDAMKDVQYEGSFVLAEHECTLAVRPGQVVNLTGTTRAALATMRATVQSVSFDLASGRTSVELGLNRQLGAEDLVSIFRSNRSRQPAERGLIRATGRF